MAKETPAAEVDITPELVRSLVDSQFPTYADLELSLVGNGWDNSMYRLGPDLVVRLPRRSMSAPLVLHEQHWLPRLAQFLTLEIPVPVGFGRPDPNYPWHWSVMPWLDGSPAVHVALDSNQHVVLAQFMQQMHRPAPTDAPENPYRGGPLSSRYETTCRHIKEMTDDLRRIGELTWTVEELTEAWDLSVKIPDYDAAPVWLHGDLHPLNILAKDGQIRAVIDFGDITSGDPATDISAAWMLFDQDQLVEFKSLIDVDDPTWQRSRGWAISLGLTYLAHSANSPAMAKIGHRTLSTAIHWPA